MLKSGDCLLFTKLFCTFALSNKNDKLKIMTKFIDTIKKGAIAEWKDLTNIVIPNTQINLFLKVLGIKCDRNGTDYGINVSDDYVDVALPNGTYTIIVKNGLVEKMSPYIELFNGDERIAEDVAIYLNEKGELDIKL